MLILHFRFTIKLLYVLLLFLSLLLYNDLEYLVNNRQVVEFVAWYPSCFHAVLYLLTMTGVHVYACLCTYVCMSVYICMHVCVHRHVQGHTLFYLFSYISFHDDNINQVYNFIRDKL